MDRYLSLRIGVLSDADANSSGYAVTAPSVLHMQSMVEATLRGGVMCKASIRARYGFFGSTGSLHGTMPSCLNTSASQVPVTKRLDQRQIGCLAVSRYYWIRAMKARRIEQIYSPDCVSRRVSRTRSYLRFLNRTCLLFPGHKLPAAKPAGKVTLSGSETVPESAQPVGTNSVAIIFRYMISDRLLAQRNDDDSFSVWEAFRL